MNEETTVTQRQSLEHGMMNALANAVAISPQKAAVIGEAMRKALDAFLAEPVTQQSSEGRE